MSYFLYPMIMAKRLGTKFICSNCGAVHAKWTGRCSQCREWNTLQEQIEMSTATARSSGRKLEAQTVTEAAKVKTVRLSVGLTEFDEVLGGGIVPGSVILLAGEPGIGKSNLLLQAAHNLAKKHKVFYISGEESARQVAMRTSRLGIGNSPLQLAVSSSANDIASTVSQGSYAVVVVDSIQSVSVY